MDFEVNPTFVHKLFEIVFANKCFGDIGKTVASIFKTIKRGAQVKIRNVEGSKIAPQRDRTLLTRSLTSSKYAVGVPTFLG